MVVAGNTIRLQSDLFIMNKPLLVNREIVSTQSDLVGLSGLK